MVEIKTRKDNLLEGSCSWILRDTAYMTWINDAGSDFFWIHGEPGKGKTMIAISLVEALSNIVSSAASSQSLLAYFFCDNSDDKRNTTMSVMKSLLHQTLSQQPRLLNLLREEFATQKGRMFSCLETIWRILHAVLKDSSLRQVYFIVDGLDECEVNSVEAFFSLVKLHRRQEPGISQEVQSCKIKWLLTSRPENHIKEHLAGCLGIDLKLHSIQVSEAVYRYIDAKITTLAVRKEYDCDLKRFVEETLRRKSEGTFLWVALVCHELRTVQSINAKKYLLDLPSGLSELYRRIMQQVRNNKDNELAAFALEILRSVTVAFRPLSLEELAVTAGLPKEVHHNLKILAKYADQCGSFLTIRRNTVHFVHQSAKDYLLSPENAAIFSPELGEENRRIATRCFQYICTEAFAQTSDYRTRPAEDLETGEDTPPYLEYPVLHSMEHGRLASPDIVDDFDLKDEFFQQDSELRLAWFHEYWKKCPWLGTLPYELPPLHLAAYFGLLWLAEKLVDSGNESDVNRSYSFRRTPLHWAAEKGHEAVARLLLEHKADVNARGISGCTALYQASEKGHEAVVRLLLDYNADVNAEDSSRWTALQRASMEGHEAVVRLLLEHNADVNRSDPYGHAPLHRAAEERHEAVVRLLLKHKADVNAKDSHRWTALHRAATKGHDAVVRLLLKHKADVNAKDSHRWTALHGAATKGHDAVVRLLLKHKADINAKDNDIWTALHRAAMKGHEAVVRLLLEHNADVNRSDSFGHTPLHCATISRHEAVVRLLLKHKADVDVKDNIGRTVFYWAIKRGNEPVMRLLQSATGHPSHNPPLCNKS